MVRKPDLEKRFVSLYTQTFGKWPAKEESEDAIWWEFVARLEADRLEPLFEAVKKEWGRRMGVPRLNQFTAILQQWQEKVPKPARTEAASLCAYCGNSGRTWYLAYRDADAECWRVSLETNHGLLYSVSVPCVCDFGAPFRFECSPQTRQGVHRWWLATLLPEAERRGIGAVTLMHELIRESSKGPSPILDWPFDHRDKVFKRRKTGEVWGRPAVVASAAMPRERKVPPSGVDWKSASETVDDVLATVQPNREPSELEPLPTAAPDVGEAGSWAPEPEPVPEAEGYEPPSVPETALPGGYRDEELPF